MPILLNTACMSFITVIGNLQKNPQLSVYSNFKYVSLVQHKNTPSGIMIIKDRIICISVCLNLQNLI